MTIAEFKLNRKKNILILQRNLIFFLFRYIKKKEYQDFLKILSKIFNLKIQTLQHETKIFFFSKFHNNKGKFSKEFNLLFMPLAVVNALLVIIFIKIFEENKNQKVKFYDILIDGLDRNNILTKYQKLNKKKKILFLIYDKKKYFKNYKNTFYFNYTNIYLEKKKRVSLKTLLKLLFLSIVLSCKLKDNLVPILVDFIKKYFKYNSVFYANRANFLIQERFYDSSSIKDEIFHQHKGKLSCLLQKNLFQINGPGMFATSDVLFSLGNKSCPNLKKYDCKIKKIIPVGSLFMESDFFNHPKFKKKKQLNKNNFDLLVFASSHTAAFHSGYESYYSEYYTHFEWIKKVAIKYPKLKIGIKHKKNYNDNQETKIFNGIKNIEYIVDRSEKFSDSYLLGYNSKSLFTWSSTLGFEILSIKKKCFFLDPKKTNEAFLPFNKVNNQIRITNYNKFEKIVINQINKLKIGFVKDYNQYCLDSSKTSENIIKYLNKHA